MAAHGPRQTPNTAPTIDPSVTVDMEPHLDPQERSDLLAERLRADATLRGHEDLAGLDITVWDDRGVDQRFVVTHASERQVDEEVEVLRPFSRPRIEGSIVSSPRADDAERANAGEPLRTMPRIRGRSAFSRLKERTTHINVGLPRLEHHGSSLNVVRRSVPIAPVYRTYVTVDVYDDAGELVDTRNQPLDDLYSELGAALTNPKTGETPDDNYVDERPRATWDWKSLQEAHKPDPRAEALEIGLTRGGKQVFEDVSEQLEQHDITNWEGLTWQLTVPGSNQRHPTHPTRRGNDSTKTNSRDYNIGLRTRTQEVLRDDTVKELDHSGRDYRYYRYFIVRTTEVYEDGSKTVEREDRFRDYELLHYLERPHDFRHVGEGSVIWNMRMPDYEARADHGLRAGWHDARQNIDPDDDQGMYIDDMLGVLDMSASYQTDDELQENAERLLDIVNAGGIDAFDDVINTMHNSYLQRLDHLGFEATGRDNSANWAIEPLLKVTKAYADHYNLSSADAFELALSPTITRNIIDERIGEAATLAATDIGRVPVHEPGDDGKPKKVGEKAVTQLKDPYEKLPIIGSPGSLTATKRWRDRIWNPIRKLTKDMHHELTHNLEKDPTQKGRIDPKQARRLGRLLSRTVGE